MTTVTTGESSLCRECVAHKFSERLLTKIFKRNKQRYDEMLSEAPEAEAGTDWFIVARDELKKWRESFEVYATPIPFARNRRDSCTHCSVANACALLFVLGIYCNA